jgi:nucleoside-diphosphate-sugar epimerase
LITGGAGFIGLHLARHLIARGAQVDIIDNFSRGTRDSEVAEAAESGAIRIFERDLTQPGVLADLETDYRYIVHLAGIVGVSRVARRPYEVLTENVAMTQNAIEGARRQTNLDRFVFLSTSEVYAGTMEYATLPLPTLEDTPLTVADLSQPRTSYMLSKIYGEAMCHQARIPFTILRPHNLYGPRMGLAHVIPELLQRAHAAPNGGFLEVHSGDHRRTFCFIDDAVEMIWRATGSTRGEGETLNIGSQAPELSMSELGTIVAQTVGKTLQIVPLPATPGSPPRRCPDMTKTSSVTTYTPRVGLVDGIRKTYEWYRSNSFAAQPAAI